MDTLHESIDTIGYLLRQIKHLFYLCGYLLTVVAALQTKAAIPPASAKNMRSETALPKEGGERGLFCGRVRVRQKQAQKLHLRGKPPTLATLYE
jgi:hypothetical protein